MELCILVGITWSEKSVTAKEILTSEKPCMHCREGISPCAAHGKYVTHQTCSHRFR